MGISEQIAQLRHDECGKCEICDDMRIKAADTMEKLFNAVVELWTVADTSDLDAEMSLFVGGCVAEEMRRDQTIQKEKT